jgi:glutathione S-transferase
VRGEITPAELAEARVTVEQLLDRLERTLDPGPWIVGDALTLADIAIAPYVFRLSALGSDQFWSKERRPQTNAWYARLSARRSFQIAVSWPDESGGGYEEVGLQAKLRADGTAA